MVVKPHSRNLEGKDDINSKNFKRAKRTTLKKKKAWCCIFQGFKEGIKKVIAKLFYKKRKNIITTEYVVQLTFLVVLIRPYSRGLVAMFGT